jgi:hypothetical protein
MAAVHWSPLVSCRSSPAGPKLVGFVCRAGSLPCSLLEAARGAAGRHLQPSETVRAPLRDPDRLLRRSRDASWPVGRPGQGRAGQPAVTAATSRDAGDAHKGGGVGGQRGCWLLAARLVVLDAGSTVCVSAAIGNKSTLHATSARGWASDPRPCWCCWCWLVLAVAATRQLLALARWRHLSGMAWHGHGPPPASSTASSRRPRHVYAQVCRCAGVQVCKVWSTGAVRSTSSRWPRPCPCVYVHVHRCVSTCSSQG